MATRASSVSACLWLCAAVLCLLALSGAAGAGYPGRSKPRSIRGFKNVALSTARGFGKRDSAAPAAAPAAAGPRTSAAGPSSLELLANGPSQTAVDAFFNERSTDSFPIDWFVEEMQSNPDLARVIVHKFVDANQDGELSPEELLRPLY